MKKKLFFIPILLGLFLSSCGNNNNNNNSSSSSSSISNNDSIDGGSDTSIETVKNNFENIAFASATYTYDGEPHILNEVSGAPENTKITYVGRKAYSDVGVYNATAKLEKDGYNDLTLSATLTINKTTFKGVQFLDSEFEYDGHPHSISITGTLPSTTSVTYTSDVNGVTNTATEIGEYNITATITDKNFETLVLKAKLTIKTNDDERYLKWSDDTLFFQNALHDNYLYSYNKGTNALLRVSKDNAVDMIKSKDDEIIYISKSLFVSSIKTANYSNTDNKVTTSVIHTANARYVQFDGSKTIYYVVNGLTQNKSGIFKADLSGEDPVITTLSVGKAKYLTLVNNKLYFADGNNGYKFSSISISGENQTPSLVVDEKINNLYYMDGVFYYTVNNLLGNYIERYSFTNGRRKLTSDAGIDFCLIDGYLYYINVDKLNTRIWGEGIYKVNASPLADNNNSGIKVIESKKGLCSLTSDGTNLYYYDMDGYKLVKANLNGAFVKDILDGFIKPEDPTPTSLGGDMEEYNGSLYYLDIWDEKTLHCYNPQTKSNTRLTANKVDNFSIIGDEIYMNMVTCLVNNDTYRFNLKTGGEPEKINTYDGTDFISDGTYVYYAQANAAGVRTAIRRTNLTTLVDEQIYDKGVSNLRMVNGELCFIDGYQIYSMNLDTLTTKEIKPNNKSVHTTVFDTDGTTIFYREMYSVAYALKRLSRYNVKTGEYAIMVQDKTDPISITYRDGDVYYYTDTTNAANNGLYKVAASTSSTSQGTCLLACNSTYYATTFTFINNSIYFTNYITAGLFGDSYIYEFIVGNNKPVKVA